MKSLILLCVAALAAWLPVSALAQEPARPATDKPAVVPDTADDLPAGARPPQPQQQPAREKAADDELLKDLTKDLFDGLEPRKKSKLADPLDQELNRRLGEGEDLGQPRDVLLELGKRMRQVETLLAERKTGESTQNMQQDIADEIAKLIEELKKNAKKSAQSASRRNQQNRDKSRVQPQNQAGQQQAGLQNNRNPRDSTERLSQGNVQDVNRRQTMDLMKQAWGHLPQHLREALDNVLSEQNLPKYEGMIREYFERLSELDQNRP